MIIEYTKKTWERSITLICHQLRIHEEISKVVAQDVRQTMANDILLQNVHPPAMSAPKCFETYHTIKNYKPAAPKVDDDD